MLKPTPLYQLVEYLLRERYHGRGDPAPEDVVAKMRTLDADAEPTVEEARTIIANAPYTVAISVARDHLIDASIVDALDGIDDSTAVEKDMLVGEMGGHIHTILQGVTKDVATVDDFRRLVTSEGFQWDLVLAGHLDDLGPRGKELAKAVRKKSAERATKWLATTPIADDIPDLPKLLKLWFPPGHGALLLLGKALLVDVVRPRLEEQKQPIRYPTDLAKTQVEHARITGGFLDDKGIRVSPPKGYALTLPFHDTLVKRQNDTIGLRQLLTDAALRTYLVTTILFQDEGFRPDGSFTLLDGVDTILDMTGATRCNQGKYHHSKNRKDIEAHLTLFGSTRVCEVGDLVHSPGDALLSKVTSRSSGRVVCYAHSRLIVGAIQTNYMQIPRQVCRLDAADIPVAIGLARVIRAQAYTYVTSRNTMKAKMVELLSCSGVDWTEGQRKHGQDWWKIQAERIQRIASEALFGEVKIHGTGRDMVLDITPSPSLDAGYSPLKASKAKHTKASKAALIITKRTRGKS